MEISLTPKYYESKYFDKFANIQWVEYEHKDSKTSWLDKRWKDCTGYVYKWIGDQFVQADEYPRFFRPNRFCPKELPFLPGHSNWDGIFTESERKHVLDAYQQEDDYYVNSYPRSDLPAVEIEPRPMATFDLSVANIMQKFKISGYSEDDMAEFSRPPAERRAPEQRELDRKSEELSRRTGTGKSNEAAQGSQGRAQSTRKTVKCSMFFHSDSRTSDICFRNNIYQD